MGERLVADDLERVELVAVLVRCGVETSRAWPSVFAGELLAVEGGGPKRRVSMRLSVRMRLSWRYDSSEDSPPGESTRGDRSDSLTFWGLNAPGCPQSPKSLALEFCHRKPGIVNLGLRKSTYVHAAQRRIRSAPISE